MPLDELIRRLRQGGLDLTAEEVADAVWLARRIGSRPPRDAPAQPPPARCPGCSAWRRRCARSAATGSPPTPRRTT
jgi:hypothetical protein